MPRIQLNRQPNKALARSETVREKVRVTFGEEKLDPKEAKLLQEYLKDFSGTKAAIRAGLPKHSAHVLASDILRRPHVLAAMHHELVQRRQEAKIEVAEVIKYWWAMATADVREFNPVRYRCCRFCWGEDNLYQFTANEFRELRLRHILQHRHMSPDERPVLDELGGVGFNQMRDPMRGPEWNDKQNSPQSCPECNGKGQARIEEVDLSKLSYGASLIFDGVRVSADGSVEFKLNGNRSKGMEQVSLLLGFVRPRKPVWATDFNDMTPEELDAILTEAEAKGFIGPGDYRGKVIDVPAETEETS